MDNIINDSATMIILQEILVFIVFAIALGYMISKFIWKPAFLKRGKKKNKNCGVSGCGCS